MKYTKQSDFCRRRLQKKNSLEGFPDKKKTANFVLNFSSFFKNDLFMYLQLFSQQEQDVAHSCFIRLSAVLLSSLLSDDGLNRALRNVVL